MLDLMRKNAGTWMVKFILGAMHCRFFHFGGSAVTKPRRGNRVAWSTANPFPWRSTEPFMIAC